jgi:PAS domain S-box-containing protein
MPFSPLPSPGSSWPPSAADVGADERLRRVLDTAYDAFVAIDDTGVITDWNAQAEVTFGWTKREAIGRLLVDTIIPPRFRDAHLAGLARFLSTGEGNVLNKRIELAAAHRDGHEFPIEFAIRALKADGKLTFNAFVRDITEHRRAQEMLRDRESQLSQAQVLAALGAWSWDVVSGVVTWSDELFRIFGLASQTTVTYELYLDRVHPDDRERVESTIQNSMSSGESFAYTHRIQRPDGTLRWLDCRAEVSLREEVPVRMFGIAQDVTGRKEAEGLQSMLASIVESSDDAIIGLTTQGVIQTWNRGAEHLYQYGADQVVGQSLGMLVPPDRRTELDMIVGAVIRGNRVERYDTQRLRKDGETIDVSVTISPICDASGNVIGAASIARDITERKRAEKAKLEALAREQDMVRELRDLDRLRRDFISNVSHELRTPLTSITGYAELLSDDGLGSLNDEQQSALDVIDRNSRRLLSLIEDILTLSHVESGLFALKTEPVELTVVIEDACKAIAAAAEGSAHELNVEISPDVGALTADADQLDRALLNLLSNAVKFTPAGGSVTVRAWRDVHEHVITVADTGMGIDPDEQDGLFRRFFRASAASQLAIQGTGLGLVIAKSIIDAHGGTISIDSLPGEGTTVTIRLPAAVEDDVA